jgi:hypothetical protein
VPFYNRPNCALRALSQGFALRIKQVIPLFQQGFPRGSLSPIPSLRGGKSPQFFAHACSLTNMIVQLLLDIFQLLQFLAMRR